MRTFKDCRGPIPRFAMPLVINLHRCRCGVRAIGARLAIIDPTTHDRNTTSPLSAGVVACVLVAATAMSLLTVAQAGCNKAAATQCQATVSNCRTNCYRIYHREEASRACHQECNANYEACRASAECHA